MYVFVVGSDAGIRAMITLLANLAVRARTSRPEFVPGTAAAAAAAATVPRNVTHRRRVVVVVVVHNSNACAIGSAASARRSRRAINERLDGPKGAISCEKRSVKSGLAFGIGA